MTDTIPRERPEELRRIEEFLATSGLERDSSESIADEVIRLIGTSMAYRQLPAVKSFVLGGEVREVLRPAPDLDPRQISVELTDRSVFRVRSLSGASLEEGGAAVVTLLTEEGGEIRGGQESEDEAASGGA